MQTTSHQGAILHDKSTRGEPLTPEEQVVLDAWYVSQDQEEAKILQRTQPTTAIEKIQAQIDTALAHMQEMARNIQQAIAENERLKRENASLRRELDKHPTAVG